MSLHGIEKKILKEALEEIIIVSARRVSKRLMEPFLDGVTNVINQIAVELVSVRKKACWFGKASWQYEKPEEFVTRSQPVPSQAAGQVDPLMSIKLVFARGKISEEEYRRRLAVLRESWALVESFFDCLMGI